MILIKRYTGGSSLLNPDYFFKMKTIKNIHSFHTQKTSEPLADDHFLPESMDEKMRWFLLPSEAHALLRGDNPFKNRNQFVPMFYPRSENALHNRNKLNRTRLKSGLANVKFCNCSNQAHRHVRNRGCVTEESSTSIKDNNKNNTAVRRNGSITSKQSSHLMDIDEVRTIYDDINDQTFSELLNGSSFNGDKDEVDGFVKHIPASGDLHTTATTTTSISKKTPTTVTMTKSNGQLPGQVWDLDVETSDANSA